MVRVRPRRVTPTAVTLTAVQLERLRTLGALLDMNRSEVVRLAIDELLRRYEAPRREGAAEDAAAVS
jgi:hypothetical protein